MPRTVGYLYRKPDSDNWWIKFQYPAAMGRPMMRKSLGTADRSAAEIRALPLIEAHKRLLWTAANERNGHFLLQRSDRLYPLGKTTRDDGAVIWAGADEALIVHPDGRHETVANGPRLAVSQDFDPEQPPGFIVAVKRSDAPLVKPRVAPKPKPKRDETADTDVALLDGYLRFKGHDPSGPYAAEARAAWAEFREIVGEKLLADWDRRDGRAYVDALRQKGLKTATVVKRVNFLAAPINHANATGDLRGNPFFRVIDHQDDALERTEFSDADMKLMHDHVLPNLDDDERLMWLILAATGMRHSEAFAIREEFERDGVRFFRVGKKTASSRREVPIPDCLTPFLPARVTGPLFQDPSLKNIAKNLMRAVRRAGITDKRKVVYSLRHRAHTRLRAVECPPDFERAIVGHETGEAHVKYGSFPLHRLKRWIDHIGIV